MRAELLVTRARGAPGRGGYVAAGIVMLLGVIAFGAILYLGLTGLSMERLVVPGSAEIALDETGRHTIYHESLSTLNGRVYDVEDVAGLSVEVVEVATGEAVHLDGPVGSTTYDLGGRSGRAVLAFDVERPGVYRLSAEYGDAGGPETVLAVGRGLGTRIAATVAGAIAVIGGAFVLAVALAALTFFRRRRARRGAAPPPAPGSPPPARSTP